MVSSACLVCDSATSAVIRYVRKCGHVFCQMCFNEDTSSNGDQCRVCIPKRGDVLMAIHSMGNDVVSAERAGRSCDPSPRLPVAEVEAESIVEMPKAGTSKEALLLLLRRRNPLEGFGSIPPEVPTEKKLGSQNVVHIGTSDSYAMVSLPVKKRILALIPGDVRNLQDAPRQGKPLEEEEFVRPETTITTTMESTKSTHFGNSAANAGKSEQVRKRKTVVIPSHVSVLPGEPPSYLCQLCKKTFQTKSMVAYHNFCVEGSIKPFWCGLCSKGFVTRTHFDYHRAVHAGLKSHSCTVCGKSFIQKCKLQRHELTHQGSKPCDYLCSVCGKTFSTRQYLQSHELIHNETKQFSCEVCGRRFHQVANLNKHKSIHSGRKPFTCKQCGKSYPLKWNLKVHMLTHGKKTFGCDLCAKSFALKKDMTRHRMIHTRAALYRCANCSFETIRSDNVVRHLIQIHKMTRTAAKGAVVQVRSPLPASGLTLEEDAIPVLVPTAKEEQSLTAKTAGLETMIDESTPDLLQVSVEGAVSSMEDGSFQVNTEIEQACCDSPKSTADDLKDAEDGTVIVNSFSVAIE